MITPTGRRVQRLALPGLDGPSRPVYGAGVLPLTSTSEVFVPPRGRAFQKFSFDFPEPSIEFRDMRFGFLVFSRENPTPSTRAA